MPGLYSTMARASTYAYMGLANTARGRYGRSAQGALLGGLAGAAYGAVSTNTSVLGGMMMGGGIGAIGGRYGRAGLMRASALSGKGMGFGTHAAFAASEFGRGVRAQALMDIRGARMMANRAWNRIPGLPLGIWRTAGP